MRPQREKPAEPAEGARAGHKEIIHNFLWQYYKIIFFHCVIILVRKKFKVLDKSFMFWKKTTYDLYIQVTKYWF